MGQWVSSKEFAKLHSLNEKSLQKACFRAFKRSKKNCLIKSIIINFNYINGIGGNAGKVLDIWSEPFKTEQEAEAFMFAHLQSLANKSTESNEVSTQVSKLREGAKTRNIQAQMLNQSQEITTLTTSTTLHKLEALSVSKITSTHQSLENTNIEKYHARNSQDSYLSTQRDDALDSTMGSSDPLLESKPSLSAFGRASQKHQNIALEKKSIIKEWERYKARGIKAKDFISLINASGEYSLSVSENKLYAWQRAYKAEGIDGLIENRGKHKEGDNKIKALGLENLIDKLILAQQGRINIANLHELLHIYLDVQGLCNVLDFKAKKSEVISYGCLTRYVNQWKKNNPIKTTLIQKGYDAAVSYYKGSVGKSNYAVSSINQVVEIDASPLDKVFDASSLAAGLGIPIEHIESWQKRYVLISLIDTYSRVSVYHISDTENSLGVARAVAKYIKKFGKPAVIKGDNGKAFLSKHTKEVMNKLDITYHNVRAYSGWLKPYVESNFRALQDRIISWGKGYIGHNVSQRQAIEFLFSKQERRLKKGQKTNLKSLDSFEEMLSLIDSYVDGFMLNRYIDDLGKTPIEAYNEKAHEAIGMNEYELNMKLGKLESKVVQKKGLLVGGVLYQSPSIFNYSRVYVQRNINNISEVFVFDEKYQFIDVAKRIDTDNGVSVEQAKLAEKISLKRIKAAQKEKQEAREAQEAFLSDAILEIAKRANKAIQPRTPHINNPHIAQAKSLEDSRKKAVGVEILESVKEVKCKHKKDLSFEAAVLKKA